MASVFKKELLYKKSVFMKTLFHFQFQKNGNYFIYNSLIKVTIIIIIFTPNFEMH